MNTRHDLRDSMFDDLESQAWIDSARSLPYEKVSLISAIEAAQDNGDDIEAYELRYFFTNF